jgi:hypothetical protein
MLMNTICRPSDAPPHCNQHCIHAEWHYLHHAKEVEKDGVVPSFFTRFDLDSFSFLPDSQDRPSFPSTDVADSPPASEHEQ